MLGDHLLLEPSQDAADLELLHVNAVGLEQGVALPLEEVVVDAAVAVAMPGDEHLAEVDVPAREAVAATGGVEPLEKKKIIKNTSNLNVLQPLKT